MQNGDIVSGVVTGIKDYGAFVQVEDYCGLIHISEFSDGFVKNINEIVKPYQYRIIRTNFVSISYHLSNLG